uniref:Uncharacterized protein n=1 Tax=Anguilla anguilla TaxID=7936 RepID=A0A0E9XJ57_ANGAN
MIREHLRSAGRHQCKRLAYSVPYGGHCFFFSLSGPLPRNKTYSFLYYTQILQRPRQNDGSFSRS